MEICPFYVLMAVWLCGGSYAAFSTSECGSSKVCFRLPENCDPSTAECVFFSSTWNGTHFNMEISGGSGNGKQYSSVAFGQLDKMQDADLYYCTGDKLESAVITEHYIHPTKLQINDEPGISDIIAATNENVAECTFARAASITKNITTGPKDFDLSADTYHILLAGGLMDSEVIIQYHFGHRRISNSTMNLTHLNETPTTPTIPSTVSLKTAITPEIEAATPSATPSPCLIKDRCIQMPKDCIAGSADCVRFTWSYEKDDKKFKMQITGGSTGSGDSYTGVAFGKVNKMENNDLYYCTGNSLGSGAITTLHHPPMQLNISKETGITNIVAQETNGVANCSFERAPSITKPISGERTQEYDLTVGKYYILLAKGSMDETGKLKFHHKNHLISDEAVQIGSADKAVFKIWFFLLSAWLLAVNF